MRKDNLMKNNAQNKSAGTKTKAVTAMLASTLALALLVAPLSAFAATAVEEEHPAITSSSLIGAAAAKADEAWTLQEMLLYAIQDEYLAQAEYDAIMNEYGTQRPFSNIIRAEQIHIELLLPLFDAYDIPVPTNDAASHTVVPESLTEIYAIGVAAEKENIAMYVSFLEKDLPDDVRIVFERLMNASVSHQRAFENAANRSGAGTAVRGRSSVTARSTSRQSNTATRGIGGYRGGL